MANPKTAGYEVTADKYRPKVFDELAGQEFVVSTIKNSLLSGHIAHAYLFSGPRGCGKTSAARILARSLNCENPSEEGTPCGVCDNCTAISQGASLDVLEIDGASTGGVNDVRQIKDEVLFPPQAGRYKVYIIDEVHMLSQAAFNALLKTIEEPPPYICFIFATTELHKVPATIKSRCQQFNFRLIPAETIQGILKKICGDYGIKADDDALFWIARESTGSMRDAFTLFDQVASFSAGHIRSELIREKLGIVGLEKLNAFAEACAANETEKVFALTDEILSSGVAIEQFVTDLAGYYRSLLLLKNGVTRESLLGYRSALFSAKVLEAYDSVRFEQALDILLECYRGIRYSVSPRFDLETAVSKLAWLNKWVSPAELKEAIDNARGVLKNAGFQPQSGATPVMQNNPQNDSLQKKTEPYSRNEAPRQVYSASSQQSSGAKPQPYSSNGSSGGRSLASEFERIAAAKEASASSDNSSDEDDVPLWDSAVHAKTEDIPPEVENVLSVIPGTVVN